MSQLLELNNGQCAIMDDRDFLRASTHKWGMDKFPNALIDGKRWTLPQYVLCKKDPKVRIFCKNGNKLDCRRFNLTTKRGETQEGMPIAKVTGELLKEIERLRENVLELEMWSGIATGQSGKLRDKIERAEAILKDGDKVEMQKYTRILKKAR